MKNIALLGSTGSIGTSSLKVIESNPERYRVLGLAGGKKIGLLIEQIERFHPLKVATIREEDAEVVRERLGGKSGIDVMSGGEGFRRLATMEGVDTVISAMSGTAGLLPTYAAIQAGKDIALANKEILVMAGPLVMDLVREKGVSILPIDSEHSAILQALQGHPREDVRRVIITASGGPFREFSLEEMERVTPEQALRHPTWNMGQKITIDSATLMNKGLEAIEAKWLFGLEAGQIAILIHPQSIVHSMVEYMDGSIVAQLGVPDMMTPISYALSYPHHISTPAPRLDLEKVGTLTFDKPDMDRFRCLNLALRAAEMGHSMPAAMNGANEVAVDAFLKGRLGFLQIPLVIEEIMGSHIPFQMESIEGVLKADQRARDMAGELVRQLGG